MKIKLKNNYSELTIEDYIKLVSISSSTSDLLDKEIEVLSVLTNLSQEELLKLPYPYIKKLVGKTTFLSEEPVGKVQKEYIIDGRKFVPNLNIYKYSAGRFIDCVELTKDSSKAMDNIHLMIAVMLDPVEKSPWYKKDKVLGYNELPITDTAEKVFKEMNIEDAIGLVNFFYHLLHASLVITRPSLVQESQMKKIQ